MPLVERRVLCMPDKEISVTLKHDYESKLDGSTLSATVKFVRRKKESDKHFRKRMRRIVKSLKNVEIIGHEVIQ
jgi:hypothetical protein